MSDTPSVHHSERPSVFTIPAGTSFVEALADGVLHNYGDDPVALAAIRIFLPNRRAVRTLREAFLRRSQGRPLILPSMQPLGDVDEDEVALTDLAAGGEAVLNLPPAVSPLRRTMLLLPLVTAWRRSSQDHSVDGIAASDDPASAFRLAVELGRFLDQVHTEDCTLDDLDTLVPNIFAAHWQVTLEFLDILRQHWPGILETHGVIDAADCRNRLLRALASRWRETPPDHPVIVAGSTGSIPASAELIRTVSRLPLGAVILPGLDQSIDDESWIALGPTHPQFGMRQLLERMAVEREEVALWPAVAAQDYSVRVRLLNEAMRPAETIGEWQSLTLDRSEAVTGLVRVDAPTRQAEAGTIALILREALEVPGRTAALVTPDRDLARRVASAMARWNIEVDDSAGRPLRETPVGVFLRLIAEAALEDFAPVPLLAVLKHPLCTAGQSLGVLSANARALERAILRGPRPGPGLEGIERAIRAEKDHADLLAWWQDLADLWSPFVALLEGRDQTLVDLMDAHLKLAEQLAATDVIFGRDRLWRGDDGEGLARFASDLRDSVSDSPPIKAVQYPALFDAALFDPVVRPSHGAHPRLAILGPLEARLHHADVMVLGSLNEDTWPPDVGADPWMSRPMRERFGLPVPERRIGLSAHDFVQGAAAPQVYLTRAEKVAGAPTKPSRWLLRLDALLGDQRVTPSPHLAWAAELDAAAYEKPSETGPQPTPPVDARPRELSVTQIENWMRDPYALYAQKILGLSALDPLDDEPDAAARGNFIHNALDQFLKRPTDEQTMDYLVADGRRAMGSMLDRPVVRAFWWPRFLKIAAWFLDQQARRAAYATPAGTEITGTMTIGDLSGGDFTLKAKADRIDRLSDGGYEIIDYKTGTPPSEKQLLAGYAAQMPLEALLLEEGGFPGIDADAVADLCYWVLKGDEAANKIKSISSMKKIESVAQLTEDAEAGLRRLIAAFDDETVAYLSRPNPAESGYGDYDHLARVKEWGS